MNTQNQYVSMFFAFKNLINKIRSSSKSSMQYHKKMNQINWYINQNKKAFDSNEKLQTLEKNVRKHIGKQKYVKTTFKRVKRLILWDTFEAIRITSNAERISLFDNKLKNKQDYKKITTELKAKEHLYNLCKIINETSK